MSKFEFIIPGQAAWIEIEAKAKEEAIARLPAQSW